MKIRYILITILILLLPFMAFGLNIDQDGNDKVDTTYGGLNTSALTGFVYGNGASYSGIATVTTTQFGYLSDVTSAIQAQLDARCLESVFGTALNADDLVNTSGTLELQPEIPHIDAAETITGNWELPWLNMDERASAPSGVEGRWARWDEDTWNPGGTSLGYGGYAIYNANSASWVINFDNRGALHLSSLTTTETEFIPISWMDITDGGADPPQSLYSTDSNSREFKIATFDGATDENLSFAWSVPSDIVAASGIKYRWHGIVTNATGPSNEAISFQLSCISIADGEQLDFASYGTAVATTESAFTEAQDDLITSAWSSAVTATGLAAGEIVHCLLNRDADGNDTYAQDFGLIGIEIKYQRTHDTTF